MENFKRAFETSFTSVGGEMFGRLFAFDAEYEAEGMKEVINRDTEIEIAKNCMALMSHRKEKILGRRHVNLFFDRRDDGLYFRLTKPKHETSTYTECRDLVRSNVIAGVSPGFSAVPIYEGNTRKFKKIFLNEISLVGNPAIDSSSVYARSKEVPKPNKILFPPECYL